MSDGMGFAQPGQPNYPAQSNSFNQPTSFDQPNTTGSQALEDYFAKKGKSEKSILKIAGGVMLVFAVIDLIVLIPALIVIFALFSEFDGAMGAGMRGFAMIIAFIGIANVAFRVVAGFMGIKYHEDGDGAKKCLVLGIIMLALGGFSLLTSLSGTPIDILMAVLSVALPAAYTYGAFQTMKFY